MATNRYLVCRLLTLVLLYNTCVCKLLNDLLLLMFVGNNVPGMYAIEVIGELPGDAIDYCEQNGLLCRSDCTKSK